MFDFTSKTKKFLFKSVAAFVAFLLIILTSCARNVARVESSNSTAKVINIGLIEPLTGIESSAAIDEINGIKFANWLYNTVNINGEEYRIKLIEADNESSTDGARRAAQKLIDEKVIAAIGSYSSSLSLAAINTLQNARIPTISATSTHPRLTYNNDYSFRICPIDPLIATIIANYVYKNGYETSAILTCRNSENSTSLTNFFRMAYTKLGGKIVVEHTFNSGDSNFDQVMERIKQSGAEFIFAPSSVIDGSKIIDASRKAGLNAKVGASDTWESLSLINSSSSNAEGAIFATFYNERNIGTEETEKFKKEIGGYLSFNGFDTTVTSNLACGYDAYMAVYRALENMTKIDNEEMRFRIDDLQYNGLTGEIRFDENGDAIRNTIYIKEIKNKHFTLLETTSIN